METSNNKVGMKLRKQVPFMDLRMELGQEGKKKMLKLIDRS
jgi:hypothetical protein